MKSKRIKSKLPEILTRDEAELAMNNLALSVNHLRQITATRDAELLATNERYAKTLGFLANSIDVQTDALQLWANSNPSEFPKDRKSLTMTGGTLGYRTSPPKLALLNRSWSWEKVLEKLKASCMGIGFVRVKEEVKKEELIGAYTCESLSREQLAEAGVKVLQDETFFIEPDLTAFGVRQTKESQ